MELYDIYGLTEIYGPGIGMSCEHACGMHYWDDYLYFEIINPRTGEVLPEGKSESWLSRPCARRGPLSSGTAPTT